MKVLGEVEREKKIKIKNSATTTVGTGKRRMGKSRTEDAYTLGRETKSHSYLHEYHISNIIAHVS